MFRMENFVLYFVLLPDKCTAVKSAFLQDLVEEDRKTDASTQTPVPAVCNKY